MTKKSGISASNLILMGGLAALLLDRNLRDRVVGGTRYAYDHGLELLEEEVVPVLSVAATRAEHGARRLAREGQHALHDWQENDGQDLMQRAQGLLETAGERAARLAKEAQKEWASRAEQAEDTFQDVRKDARRTAMRLADQGEDRYRSVAKDARRTVRSLRSDAEETLDDAHGSFLGFLSRSGDELEDRRNQMERDLKRARRDVERDLRRGQRHWNPQKLEKTVAKRLAPLQKEAEREFARFEKDVMKQKRLAERQARSEGGMGGGAALLLLLGAGAVALARMPEARTAVLQGVEKVSPDARHHLERVGRSFKASVGEVWIEGPKKDEKPFTTANKSVDATGDASKDSGNPKTGAEAPASMNDKKPESGSNDKA
ncbi:hypothetical protein [Deinococcus radiophilus]|uniref:Alginate biosynthesis protein AlgP n=2 Tax=Deinococcus radiophilus TaxID=32062 RepID=A0A431VZP1_9DEIO|nr:hypothetical protein [Deinococcus radiophilus]RTR28688.1 hypothetical protein EJ104_04865 [Deinococcus radiophilus]UFA51111.1 hypothetical protein LMT64_04225 [Deinococcus radiophilus]